MTVTFGRDHNEFTKYRFPWASVHPHGVLPVPDVRDASVQAGPPEIRTVAGETLFLPWDDKAALATFCERHGIAVVSRFDVVRGPVEQHEPDQVDRGGSGCCFDPGGQEGDGLRAQFG